MIWTAETPSAAAAGGTAASNTRQADGIALSGGISTPRSFAAGLVGQRVRTASAAEGENRPQTSDFRLVLPNMISKTLTAVERPTQQGAFSILLSCQIFSFSLLTREVTPWISFSITRLGGRVTKIAVLTEFSTP